MWVRHLRLRVRLPKTPAIFAGVNPIGWSFLSSLISSLVSILFLFLFLLSASVSFSFFLVREKGRYIYICECISERVIYIGVRERYKLIKLIKGGERNIFIGLELGLGVQCALATSELEIRYLQIESIHYSRFWLNRLGDNWIGSLKSIMMNQFKEGESIQWWIGS